MGLSCCCKDSCFSFQECCCFACPVQGEGGPLQRTTIANEINRNSKIDLGPMQTICFLIWSSRRRDKQRQFSERCLVFLFIKERENISDERVPMFVRARIWSNCDLKMHSQICSQPDIGVPQYNSVGRDKPYTQALTTMLGNYLLI